MKTFKVIDPKGVTYGGKSYAPGETLTSTTPLGAHVLSFVHFKQVEEVKEEAAEKAPPADPSKVTLPAEPPAVPKGKGGK